MSFKKLFLTHRPVQLLKGLGKSLCPRLLKLWSLRWRLSGVWDSEEQTRPNLGHPRLWRWKRQVKDFHWKAQRRNWIVWLSRYVFPADNLKRIRIQVVRFEHLTWFREIGSGAFWTRERSLWGALWILKLSRVQEHFWKWSVVLKRSSMRNRWKELLFRKSLFKAPVFSIVL